MLQQKVFNQTVITYFKKQKTKFRKKQSKFNGLLIMKAFFKLLQLLLKNVINFYGRWSQGI